jgi:hypothetical protein
MAQTTDAISVAGFKAEVSPDGTSWTDISGTAATVAVDGGDAKVGVQHTAEGGQPVVVPANKTEAVTVTVRALYTETTGEAWKVVDAAYQGADKKIFLRWSPAGGATGDLQYTTAAGGAAAAGAIVNCLPPELDAGGEDVAMFEFSVMAAGLVSAAVSS